MCEADAETVHELEYIQRELEYTEQMQQLPMLLVQPTEERQRKRKSVLFTAADLFVESAHAALEEHQRQLQLLQQERRYVCVRVCVYICICIHMCEPDLPTTTCLERRTWVMLALRLIH